MSTSVDEMSKNFQIMIRKPNELIRFLNIREHQEFIWFLIMIKKNIEFILLLLTRKPYDSIWFGVA